MPIHKIISGGQTGVDQIALKVGRILGIETGGTAPKGWKTENGPQPQLKEYGLIESPSDDYSVRTEDNVRDADVTVWFGNTSSAGAKCTLRAIRKHKKEHCSNPSPVILLMFLRRWNPEVINVAGNRGSHLTKSQRDEYGRCLLSMIECYNKTNRFDDIQ
jgi:hypothetical protein